MYSPLLDRLLFRAPFEGHSARRYARRERPAFGDLDERLLDRLALDAQTSLLDLGCGPGTFALAAARRHPQLQIIAVDPSRDYRPPVLERVRFVTAFGEALPIADRSVDVAICLSSIRHVRDRAATLRELRRSVRERVWIVELDPVASRVRIRNHARRLGSPVLRLAFGPLVVRTAPPVEQVEALARDAGFAVVARAHDPEQPVYILELA